MIGYLKGVVQHQQDDYVVLLCQNVGYVVHTFQNAKQMFSVGDELELWIDTRVRENEIALYGFTSNRELTLFQLLTTVPSVGPKVALAILASIATDELIYAISTEQKEVLVKANGVGPKMASRIITDLKSKIVEKMGVVPSDIMPTANNTHASSDTENINLAKDLKLALEGLGYKGSNLQSTVNQLVLDATDDEKELSVLIPRALRILSSH